MRVKEKLIFAILITILLLLAGKTFGLGSYSNGVFNLTAWDDTDNTPKKSGWNNIFYGNFTNSSSGEAISDGNCSIRFQNYTNDYGNWTNMTYIPATGRFQYNATFNYKGTYLFNINCSNASSSINVTDNFTITNSIPEISKEDRGDGINFDGNDQNEDFWPCVEDTECYYNFTANITEYDINDILTYSYSIENTTLTNYTLNPNGMLLINVTNSINTGNNKKIQLKVTDTESTIGDRAFLKVNIQEVNDAPYFVGLENWTVNMTEPFTRTVNISDEENNVPFTLGIDFISCGTAGWSDRNSTNCTLFTNSSYTFDPVAGILELNLPTSRNDVGSYIVNFSVTDNSTLGDKTGSQAVNITVMNVNEAPVFTYICNNERNATEDSEFTCWINATDIDESYNLTFTANYSWFTFNGTGVNWTVQPCNSSTEYNASALVNFTARDSAVGNWSVNISVKDIGTGYGAPKVNFTIIKFFINNTEDNVSLKAIDDYLIYEDKTFYINATDDDLLVPDKSIKNEVLTFASNTSWVNVSSYYSNSNYTTARVIVNYDLGIATYGGGNHTIKINVSDTGGNLAERTFVIGLGSDNPAQWNSTMNSDLVIYEDNSSYFNFSQNVSDTDVNSSITFSYTSSNSFPSFGISSAGIIDFTPVDQDVGFHNITVNASDGMLDSLKYFNFTVYNINDAPYVVPIQAGTQDSYVVNATVDSSTNIICTEDNYTYIRLLVEDDDFRIPPIQRSFYNESHTLTLTIQGPNTALFTFSDQYILTTENFSEYETAFTPKKADLGQYNITINITDRSNVTYTMSFNLTINSINHDPVLMNLTNASTTINSNFYYRINATDTEDGDSTQPGNTNFTFSYALNQGNDIFNQTTFNSATGEISINLNSSQGGIYHLNVTVNDSTNRQDTGDFWIYVYDIPSIEYPLLNYEYNLNENEITNLTFNLNNSVGTNLTYKFYIEDSNGTDVLRYNLSYYGNGTNLTWVFTPNLTDETYGAKINLTLIAYPVDYAGLNISRTWNLTINHTNAPIVFYDNIDDHESAYGTTYSINLSHHFSDIDSSDYNYNQSIDITIWSNSSPSLISWNTSGWILNLFSAVATTELLTINVSDLEGELKLTNETSNTFQITFIPPEVQTITTPSTGGGGGGASTTPMALKIIFPNTVDAFKKDRIEVPITLENTGKTNLYKINLTSLFKKDNQTRTDAKLKFSQFYFDSLLIGEKKNTTLTIDVNTEETGAYEVFINATVESPKYGDWGVIHLNVKESNKSETMEKLLFTEEFIAQNPECIEIKEIVDEAWEFYYNGDYENALSKSREAIDSCRYAISQPAIPRVKESIKERLYKYLSWTSLVLFAVLILYYIYSRIRIKMK